MHQRQRAGGYAYLPCSGGTADDIVIRNAQFGSIGTSGGSNLAVRSLTHEIGHYFGLLHTWGGAATRRAWPAIAASTMALPTRPTPLAASYLTGHFQVRLVMLSNGGNYFYLDHLAVGASPLLATRRSASSTPARIYPNPLTAKPVVEFTLAAPGPVELHLTGLVGRPVGVATRATGQAGLQTLPLLPADAARPASGIYLIELHTANGRSASKVVIP